MENLEVKAQIHVLWAIRLKVTDVREYLADGEIVNTI